LKEELRKKKTVGELVYRNKEKGRALQANNAPLPSYLNHRKHPSSSNIIDERSNCYDAVRNNKAPNKKIDLIYKDGR
jgi:hypothetical protein